MLLLLMPAPALFRFDPNIVLQKYYDTFKMWFMFMTLYDFLAKMTLKTTLKSSKATVFWNGITGWHILKSRKLQIEVKKETLFSFFWKIKFKGGLKLFFQCFMTLVEASSTLPRRRVTLYWAFMSLTQSIHWNWSRHRRHADFFSSPPTITVHFTGVFRSKSLCSSCQIRRESFPNL